MIWVLFVDDDPEICSIAKQYLAIHSDIVVNTVESARESLYLLQKNPYTVIVSDYFMPDMDGVTFLKKVRTLNTHIPFIIYTGHGDETAVIEALNNGADFYLKKSYEIRTQFFELAQIIRLSVARVQSEELLRKSEEKFRTIAEYSLEWMYWIDPGGRMAYVSPSCEQVTGYLQEDFYQDPDLRNRIIYKEDSSLWSAHLDESSSEKISLALDIRIVHKDGGLRWIGHVCQPIFDADGNCAGRRVSNRDITSRKKTEELLLRERDNFLQIFQTVPVGLLLLNTDTEIVQANTAISEMILRDPAEIIRQRGGGGLGCIHSQDDPRGCGYSKSCPDCPLRSGIESVIRERIRIHGVVLPLTLLIDGKPALRWLSVSAEPVTIEGTDNIIVAIDDITEQREIEDSLRESEEHYRSLFENMFEGYAYCRMLYDTDGIPSDWMYVDVNDAFEKLTGLSGAKGRLVSELIPGIREQTPELFEMYNRVVVTGIAEKMEINFTPLQIWLQLSVYRPKEGHFVAVFENITERKRTEDAVINANHKLNLLSGITRHDIGNELQIMFGYLGFAKEEDLDPRVKGYIAKVDGSAHNIERQLAFTRDYQDIGVNSPAWQDIRDVISQVVRNLDLSPVQLRLDISGVGIYADPLLEKVFSNLIDNAKRYGETITRIQFSGIEGSEGYTIICEDDGIGIPEEFKEKIFRREYYKHTGFGLNLSREILEITGITIRERGVPGKGARFEIAVPVGRYRISQTEEK